LKAARLWATLSRSLDAYIKAAGIGDEGKSPLFRSAAGRNDTLTEKPMNRVDAWRMIQRRAADLGTHVKVGCHTFRATGITLEAGVALENAQAMAAHESPRDRGARRSSPLSTSAGSAIRARSVRATATPGP
jgi:integrase